MNAVFYLFKWLVSNRIDKRDVEVNLTKRKIPTIDENIEPQNNAYVTTFGFI